MNRILFALATVATSGLLGWFSWVCIGDSWLLSSIGGAVVGWVGHRIANIWFPLDYEVVSVDYISRNPTRFQ